VAAAADVQDGQRHKWVYRQPPDGSLDLTARVAAPPPADIDTDIVMAAAVGPAVMNILSVDANTDTTCDTKLDPGCSILQSL
jgi:hypothetical protein